MGRKIFVSYKYADSSVKHLSRNWYWETTTVRDYVDEFQEILSPTDHIYKGECDGEDLSQFKDETIESKLRDKIYDSSITVIFISPNMKESWRSEKDQWIPWEIAYSLKECTRNGRTHHSNALICVVLPDSSGSYEYALREKSCCADGCRVIDMGFTFKIIQNNIFNNKCLQEAICKNGDFIYKGAEHSYIYLTKWEDFNSLIGINAAIIMASCNQQSINEFDICKTI